MASRSLELLIQLKIIGEAELAKLKQQLEALGTLGSLGDLGIDLGSATAEIEELKRQVSSLSAELETVQAKRTRSGGDSSPTGASSESVSATQALAKALGIADSQADELAKSLGQSAEQVLPLVSRLEKLEGLDLSVDDQFKAIAKSAGLTREQFDQLRGAADLGDIAAETRLLAKELNLSEKEARELKAELSDVARQELKRRSGSASAPRLDATGGSGGRVGGSVFSQARAALNGGDVFAESAKGGAALASQLGTLASGIFAVQSAWQVLSATALPLLEGLISKNEELNRQILSAQTGLASATRVSVNGEEITGAIEEIQATRGKIESALRQVEKDTLSLSGLQTSQVNEAFGVLLQNATALNQQSKEFPDSIQAATVLTKGFAAAISDAGLDMSQIRQEVNSIFQGNITADSAIAQRLQIDNATVRQWQQQGVLVDRLNEKLSVFVGGNALAARSVEGITSNLKEFGDIVQREAGRDLTVAIVDQLKELETLLFENQDAIVDYFKFFAEGSFESAREIGETLKPAFDEIGAILLELAPLVQSIFTLVTLGAKKTAKDLEPIITPLLKIIAFSSKGLKSLGELATLPLANRAQEDLDALAESTRKYDEEVGRIGLRLKELNEIEANPDIELTPGQAEELAKLREEANALTKDLDSQVLAYKAINAVTPEVQENRDAAIDGIEKQRQALDGLANQITIEANALPVLGNSLEQLAEQASAAAKTIEQEGSGSPQRFTQAAKQLIDITKQQAELGQITQQEAEERLSALAENTKLEVGLQRSAAEAIEGIRKQQVSNLKTTTEAEIAVLESRAALGGAAQIEIQRELGEKRKVLLDEQLKSLQEAIAKERDAIEEGRGSERQLAELEAQEKQLSASRIKLAQDTSKGIIDAEKQINDVRRQGIQDQIRDTERAAKKGEIGGIEAAKNVTRLKQQELDTQLEDTARAISKEQQLIAEGTGNETRLATLRAEQEKLNDQREDLAIEGAEKVRQKEIEAIQRTATDRAKAEADTNLEIAEARADGVQDAIASEQIKLQAALDRGEKEIEAELKKLEVLKQAPDTGSNRDAIAQQEVAITRLRAEQIQQREALERQSIQRLERDRRVAEEQIAISQAERNNDITEREIRLREAGVAEVDIRRSIAQEQTAIQEEEITRRLNDEKKFLAELERLQASGEGGDPEQLEQDIRSAKLKTAQLVGELLSNEKTQREQLTAQIIADIERERQASETARQAIISGIERQQQLQASERNLADSVLNVELARLNQRKSLTKSDKQRQRIELQIAEIQRKALLARQKGERLSLELTQKRALIENKIAQTNARAALRKARAEGATDEDKADLAANVTAFEQLGDLLNTTQAQERQALTNNQKAERIGADTDVKLARKAIAEGGKALGDSLKDAGKDIKESGKDLKKSLEGLTKDEIDREDFIKLSVEDQQKLNKGFRLGESVEDRQRRARGFRPGESVEDRQKRIAAGIPTDPSKEKPEDKAPEKATADNTAKVVEQAIKIEDAIKQQTNDLKDALGEGEEPDREQEAIPQAEPNPPQEAPEKQSENIDQQLSRALLERVSPEDAIARENGMIEAITQSLENAPSSEQRASLQTERAALESKARDGGLTDEENVRLTDVIGGLSRTISDADRATLEKERADREEVRSRLEEGGNGQDVRNLRALYLERAGIGRGTDEDRSLKFVQDEQLLAERGAAFAREKAALAEQQARSDEAASLMAGPELSQPLLQVEEQANAEDTEAIEAQTAAIEDQTETLKGAIEAIPRPKQFRDGTGGKAATPVGEGFTVGEAGAELVTNPTTGKTQLFTGESFIAADNPLVVYPANETAQIMREWDKSASSVAPAASVKVNPILPVPTLARVFTAGGAASPTVPSSPVSVTVNQAGGMDGAAIAALASLHGQLSGIQGQMQRLGQYSQNTASNTQGAASDLAHLRRQAQSKGTASSGGVDLFTGAIR